MQAKDREITSLREGHAAEKAGYSTKLAQAAKEIAALKRQVEDGKRATDELREKASKVCAMLYQCCRQWSARC